MQSDPNPISYLQPLTPRFSQQCVSTPLRPMQLEHTKHQSPSNDNVRHTYLSIASVTQRISIFLSQPCRIEQRATFGAS
jgi:hypothetical protein